MSQRPVASNSSLFSRCRAVLGGSSAAFSYGAQESTQKQWTGVGRSFELVRETREAEQSAMNVSTPNRTASSLPRPSQGYYYTPPASPCRSAITPQSTPPPSTQSSSYIATPTSSKKPPVLDGRYPREAPPRSILQHPSRYETVNPHFNPPSQRTSPLPSPQGTPRRGQTPTSSSRCSSRPPRKDSLEDPFFLHSSHILRPSQPPSLNPSPLPSPVPSRSSSPQPSHSKMSRYSSTSSSVLSSQPSQSSLHPVLYRSKLSSRASPRPASRLLKRSSGISQNSNRSRRRQPDVMSADLLRAVSAVSESIYSQCSDGEANLKSPTTHPHMLASPVLTPSPLVNRSSSALKRMGSLYSEWLPPVATPKSDEDLLEHWNTFVSDGSPLIRSQSRRPLIEAERFATRNKKFKSPPQPRALPNTLSHLQSRLSMARRVAHNLPRPGSMTMAAEMTRVDSQVALARLALKRLGSGNELSLELEGNRVPAPGSTEWMPEQSYDWWDIALLDDAIQKSNRESCSIKADKNSVASKTASECSSDATSFQYSDGSRASMASTSRTSTASTSIGELELNLEKFARELDFRLDDLSEEDDYVCALDLISEDFGFGDNYTLPKSASRSSLPASSSSSSLSSRIPRPKSLASLSSTPPPIKPTSLLHRKKSSIPVRASASPSSAAIPVPTPTPPTPPTRAKSIRKMGGGVPTSAQMGSWAKERRYTRPMRQ